ncbi:hypothetical protein IZY60_13785 [Lutibacter sp. B2]|nr:hypothetical protein [Lutibacter sp. B2]
MRLKKVFKVIFVDCFSLLVGILNGLFLPKIFNIDQYSFFKTFGLYASYAGIFHFGFSDGIYILLGGKKEKDIDKEKVRGYYELLLKIEIIVLTVFIFMNVVIIKNIVFRYFILYVFPFQMVHFFRLYYRSIGKFDSYSLLQASITTIGLINTLLTVFFFKSPDIYIVIQILSYIVVAIYISFRFYLHHPCSKKVSFKEFRYIVELGFTVMIANTVAELFFSLDRWFLKFGFSSNEFAYYSFAVSMLTIFIKLINSVMILLYPYFSVNITDDKSRKVMKKYLIIITSFAPTSYFVLKYIVGNYLNEYIKSIDILGILILAVPFIALINILYSNLYKASKSVKKYLTIVCLMFCVTLILNVLSYLIFKNPIMIACATVTSFFIWYLYSSKDFEGLEVTRREILFFIVYFITFSIVLKFKFGIILPGLVFVIVIAVSEWIFFREHVTSLIKCFCKTKESSN